MSTLVERINVLVDKKLWGSKTEEKVYEKYQKNPTDSDLKEKLVALVVKKEVHLKPLLELEQRFTRHWTRFVATGKPNDRHLTRSRNNILKKVEKQPITNVHQKNRSVVGKLVKQLEEYMAKFQPKELILNGLKLKKKITDTEQFIATHDFTGKGEIKERLVTLVDEAKNAPAFSGHDMQPIVDIITTLVEPKKQEKKTKTKASVKRKREADNNGSATCLNCKKEVEHVLDFSMECYLCFERKYSIENKRINGRISGIPKEKWELRKKIEALQDDESNVYRIYCVDKNSKTASELYMRQKAIYDLVKDMPFDEEDIEDDDSMSFGRDKEDDDDELMEMEESSADYSSEDEEDESSVSIFEEEEQDEEVLAKFTLDYMSNAPEHNTRSIIQLWKDRNFTTLNSIVKRYKGPQTTDQYVLAFYLLDEPETLFYADNQPLYFDTEALAKEWAETYLGNSILLEKCGWKITKNQV